MLAASRVSSLAFLMMLVVSCSNLIFAAVPPPTDDAIDKIVDRYVGGPLEGVWQGAVLLERLGDDSIGGIQQLMSHENRSVRLMASKALLSLGETEGIRDVLIAIGENGDAPSIERSAAISLMSDFRDKRTERALRAIAESEAKGDGLLRVAVGKCLYQVTRDRKLARELLHPLLEVDDSQARTGAAIALAQLGLFDGDVKNLLRSIELEPTAQGALAKVLLERDRLMRSLERKSAAEPAPESERIAQAEKSILQLETLLLRKDQEIERLNARRSRGNSTNHPLLDEIIRRIRHFYVEPELVDDEQLLIEAAKGMVGSLDPFSSFMDVKDTKEFYEGITGEYAGIGAQVQMDPDSQVLKIIRPIYKGPAYRSGMISEDLVIEVDGLPTKGKPLDEIVKGLKGKPGTSVSLKVFRRGWREARDFEITRETIQLDSVLYQMLPGKLGYISLAQFGDTAVEEVIDALDELENQGMRGLIFDLRSNPGGYLQSAVSLVDEFIDDKGMPIVSQKSMSGVFEDSEKFATKGMRDDYPMVVLVNGSSASASEIVSGALQDFKRAKLIGERTYGKGSVQRLLPMADSVNRLLGGESTLRLTVQHYYLPSGRSIHTQRDADGKILVEGGIDPDIFKEPLEIPLWRIEALGRLSDNKAFEEWIDAHYEGNKELVAQIVESGDDHGKIAYPGFDSWFEKQSDTGVTKDDARYGLRIKLRRLIEDERGSQIACDYVEDVQLQTAILELLGSLGTEVSTIPQYVDLVIEEIEDDQGESL
ncbi:MAG: S41 family peptidase [Planctomycetota bacterium]|nr:S41 family peptidase [Planctomycetota bacterium]